MIPILIAAGIAAAAPAAPGNVETFRDWAVGCDNGRACEAVSLLPARTAGDAPPGTVAIARDAGADAPVRIRLRAHEQQRRPVAIAIDGRRIAAIAEVGDGVYAPAPADAPRVLAALLGGGSATLIDAGGAVQGRASLAGIAAAARFIDDRQQRAGGVTAWVATGPAPASAVPAALALPVVATPDAVDDAPPASPELVKRLTGGAGCANDVPDSETHRLDAKTALILVTCWSGAYNTDAIAFTAPIDRLDAAVPARFDYDASSGPDSRPDAALGGYWDGDASRLKAIAKGRGIGDCGTSTDWAWDGTRFRLIELRTMPECRGAVDWIRVWRAAVD